MAEPILLDNDVVLKVASYGLGAEALAVTVVDGVPPAMLGVGRFVVSGRLERSSKIVDIARAQTSFDELLATVHLIEPNGAELALAADLEAAANRRDLDLDGGESQLLAILATRGNPLLITGDKRAILAIALVAPSIAADRIACLEQLIRELVNLIGHGPVGDRVCVEPAVDRALTACFGCARGSISLADVTDGLASYIGHLHTSAPGVLMPGFGGLET